MPSKKDKRLMGVDSNFINRYFNNQYGLDIETTGSAVESGGILQIGVQTPSGMSYEINVQQDKYTPSKFHSRKGGLHDYYQKQGINPEQTSNFTALVERERRYYSAVVNKERAKKITQNLIRPGNQAANLIIHNANFEIKHFNSFYDGASPFQFSSEYKDLISANAAARWEDEKLFKAGRLSAGQYRSNDIARQLRVYDQILIDAQKGGSIIDSMELAKTANALAQQRGIVARTGDLALGSNVENLASIFLGQEEVHRAVSDVWQQNQIAPKLVGLVEKLRRPDFKMSMLNAQENAWVNVFKKDHVKLKVHAQKKAIQQAIDNLSAGRPHLYRSGSNVAHNIDDFINYLGQTGEFTSSISQGIRLVDHGIAPKDVVQQAIGQLDDDYKKLLSSLRGKELFTPSTLKTSTAGKVALGAIAAIGVAGFAKGLISGGDDQYNTIEGLKHGWYGNQRNESSDFGSGYKGASQQVQSSNPLDLHNPVDQTPDSYMLPLGGLMAYGVYKGSHLLPSNTAVNSLSYLGHLPEQYSSWSQMLGRDRATYGDLLFNAVKRFEHSFSGIPKAFSVSTLMSPSVFRDTTFSVRLTDKAATGYNDYLNKLLGRNLLEEGITGVEYRGGKLFVSDGKGVGSTLLNEARLYQAVHDRNLFKSQAQFTKSYQSIMGSAGIGSSYDFMIGGGQTKLQALMTDAHAYAHESFSKYLRLMDDPAKALRDLAPDISENITDTLGKITRRLPKMGVGGEQHLIGTLPQLIGRHATRALPLLIGLPALYGTASWAVRQLAPEDTVAGKAGLTGIAAEGGRLAHMTYAHISDMTGLTSLRKSAEEQAPGMTGVMPFLGMSLSFGLTGAVTGATVGLAMEAFSKDRYGQLLANKAVTHELPKVFSKIPGLGGKYTLAGKYGRMGAIMGGTLALPMLLAGLGSSKSAAELDEEYLGGKEVAIKKGRWWELGMTPFEGAQTMYYRKNWYNRVLGQSDRKAMYGDEDISPIGELARTMLDPYWKEKMHYDDRPYPIASASGEHLGIFSVAYERTIGQVLKPTAFMHTEGLPQGTDYSGVGMGSQSGEMAMRPNTAKEDIKQQYYNTYEALGLRGFALASLKEAITGESDLFESEPTMQSSGDMDNIRKQFWDLNIGGFFGLSEPLRRFMPNRPFTDEKVNTITNTMPSWLPGDNYYKNFKQGDPYSSIPEGNMRLPGAGYAALNPDVAGLNPENYPLLHKYKILADVAMDSSQFRGIEKQVNKASWNEEDQNTIREIQAQVADKRQKRRFIYDEQYQGIFGKYSKAVATIAQDNPIEQLTPFSPAHKFLPVQDPRTQYEEMIFGKEFKQWQSPVDDFIKPFLYSTGNLIGVDKIPPEVEEVRRIEQYFDELKYIKFKKLQGTGSGNYMQNKSLLGADPYAENFNMFLMPKRERQFVEGFKEMNLEDKNRVLALAPENLKDIYQGQWDVDLMNKIESGEIQMSEQERAQVAQAIEQRKEEARARRELRRREVMSSQNVPPDDWIGWNPDVDLEDVKLKYLMNNGKEYHYYDLWDDRARRLRTKPIVSQAAMAVDPLATEQDNKRLSRAEMLQWAINSGVKDPVVMTGAGVSEGLTLDVAYDSTAEEDAKIRELGLVV